MDECSEPYCLLRQVFGITEEDHSIVFRTGVAGASDPSGKTWKPVTAVPVRMRSFSASSSVSAASSIPAHPRTPPAHARREQLSGRSEPGSPNPNSGSPPQDNRSPAPGQTATATETVEGTSNSRFKVTRILIKMSTLIRTIVPKFMQG